VQGEWTSLQQNKHAKVKKLSSIFVFSLAVFTLEDEQIVWTDKSSQMDKSSDVQTG